MTDRLLTFGVLLLEHTHRAQTGQPTSQTGSELFDLMAEQVMERQALAHENAELRAELEELQRDIRVAL